MSAPPGSTDRPKPEFLAFVNGNADIATLKAFVAAHQWPEASVQQGDIRTATQYLGSNPAPNVLLIEVSSAEEAPGLLDGLANVCDPDTKVIIAGNINEYSFYCWLTEIGVFSYLLLPLAQPVLEANWQKAIEPPAAAGKNEKQPGKVIAVIGTRGGVGASTVTLNLAGVFAELSKKQVALVDIDPQEGSLALTLDIEPSRGIREALEKPDRIDSMFMDRVMTKPLKNLALMSAEEALQERFNVHEHAADALLKELRAKFDIVILDVPRYITPFSRQCLKLAEQVVLVTEMTLLSLRDALRINDFMRDALKMKPPIIVANRISCAPKQEMAAADFEKGINAKITQRVPFAPELYMQIGNEIPSVKHKAHAGIKPIYELAIQLLPELKGKGGTMTSAPQEKKGLNFFKKKA